MSKELIYAMTGEKSCLLHVLMNAVDLSAKGFDVKIIFEGQSVLWPARLNEEKNPHYMKAFEQGLIAGICLACSKQLDVLAVNEALGIPLMGDMFGHAPMSPYLQEGYQVISM